MRQEVGVTNRFYVIFPEWHSQHEQGLVIFIERKKMGTTRCEALNVVLLWFRVHETGEGVGRSL